VAGGVEPPEPEGALPALEPLPAVLGAFALAALFPLPLPLPFFLVFLVFD
jgi:hypothetical protein